MKINELEEGTIINGKYRVLKLKADTCFGTIYKAFSTSGKGSDVELYQLNDDIFDVKKSEILAKKIEQFKFEGVTYIVVPAEENTENQQESILLELQEIDDIYSKGVSKKKYKYRMEANKRYERIRNSYNELFLKHLSSVNNLADDYLYYYGEDYTNQAYDSYSEEVLDKKAFVLYTESAYRNSAYGQYQLAYCYEKGYGCECNYSLAAEWYEESFKNGFTNAARKLGDFYFKGLGVKQNYTTAFNYYLKVQENNSEVCMILADCYSKGLGVEPNDEKMFEYLNKAYELGNYKSILSLAECYLTGNGTEKNFARARVLLKKAALRRMRVSDLIHDYYLREKISLVDKIKGVGYIALSNWNYIALILGYSILFTGLILFTIMIKH